MQFVAARLSYRLWPVQLYSWYFNFNFSDSCVIAGFIKNSKGSQVLLTVHLKISHRKAFMFRDYDWVCCLDPKIVQKDTVSGVTKMESFSASESVGLTWFPTWLAAFSTMATRMTIQRHQSQMVSESWPLSWWVTLTWDSNTEVSISLHEEEGLSGCSREGLPQDNRV
jgi:hypothetical protein